MWQKVYNAVRLSAILNTPYYVYSTMANPDGHVDTLIPFDKRTEDEQRKITTAGGIASGIARRKKRSTQEIINICLDMDDGEGEPVDIQTIQNIAQLQGQNLSVEEALIYQQIIKARRDGDTGAFRTIMALGNRFPRATDEGPTGGIQNQYNAMVFVVQGSQQIVDEDYAELTELGKRHGEMLKPKEEYYKPHMVITEKGGKKE